jgi:archaellum biogenesis ATPase FlaH
MSDNGKSTLVSIEAEENVLGSLLIAGADCYDEIRWLQPEDFYELKNNWIFAAIRDLIRDHLDVDASTVAEVLKARRQLEDLNSSSPGSGTLENKGRAYLTYLWNGTPTHIHIYTYARIVEAAARRRRAIDMAGKLAQTALERSSSELLGMAESIYRQLEAAADHVSDGDGMRSHLYHVSELKNLPSLTWLIPGEVPEHGLTLVYGRSGVGKSFFALNYALSLAATLPVVYIATEGETGYGARVAAWAEHQHVDVDGYKLYFYMNVVCLLDEPERQQFSRLIKNIGPKLIIIDTLAHSMLPGNENDSRDMGLFLRAAKKLQQEHSCAVLMVHHTNKGGLDERGHSSLRPACDTMIRLDEEDQIITVQCAKTKDSIAFPTRYIRLLPVKLPDGTSSPVLVTASQIKQTCQDPLSPMQLQVLEVFALETFAAGASMTDVAEVTRVARGTIQKVASRLAMLGFLIRTAGGSYQISEQGRQRLTLNKYSADSTDSTLTPPPDSSKNPVNIGLTPVTPSKHESLIQESLIGGVSGVSGVREADSPGGSSLTPVFENHSQGGVSGIYNERNLGEITDFGRANDSPGQTSQEKQIAARHPASLFGPRKGKDS